MDRARVLFTAALFSLWATPSGAADTLLRAGHLLDPRTGKVLSPAAVLVRGNKIAEVGPPLRVETEAAPGTKSIDPGSAALLPGLSIAAPIGSSTARCRRKWSSGTATTACSFLASCSREQTIVMSPGYRAQRASGDERGYADVVAVSGDPVGDVTELERVRS
jgi:hypothetical protein